jgi:glycolate oxidase
LAGLFLGWAGTTGVVTKVALKLFPNRPLSDVGIFVLEDPEKAPDVIARITGVGLAEDVTAWMTPKPDWAKGFIHINSIWTADTPEELVWKRNLIRSALRTYMDEKSGGFMVLPPPMKKRFLEAPSTTLTQFADVRKGGGFEYVGAIMPIEKFPEAYHEGLRVAEECGTSYSTGARVVGQGHCMMFFWAYAFNRADETDVKRAQNALEETNRAALDLGGIPWKAEAPAQAEILKRTDPATVELMKRVRAALDPAGIMNPGNWEAS